MKLQETKMNLDILSDLIWGCPIIITTELSPEYTVNNLQKIAKSIGLELTRTTNPLSDYSLSLVDKLTQVVTTCNVYSLSGTVPVVSNAKLYIYGVTDESDSIMENIYSYLSFSAYQEEPDD